MYAVVKTGGKQYKVTEGDELLVEKLEGNKGDKLRLSEVLLVSTEDKITVGTPQVKSVTVDCEIIAQEKGEKIKIFKHKRRKNSRKLTGHRQDYTRLRIQKINI